MQEIITFYNIFLGWNKVITCRHQTLFFNSHIIWNLLPINKILQVYYNY